MSLLESGVFFTEYGTRRRRSLHTHDLVVRGLKRASEEWTNHGEGKVLGTSNVREAGLPIAMSNYLQVYLAYKHGIKPSGTIAQ